MADKDSVDWLNRRTVSGADENLETLLNQDGQELRACRDEDEGEDEGEIDGPISLDDAQCPGWEQQAAELDSPAVESLAAEPVAVVNARKRNHSLLWIALATSGTLHTVILAVLLLNRATEPPAAMITPETVRINLVSPALQSRPAVAESRVVKPAEPDNPAQAPEAQSDPGPESAMQTASSPVPATMPAETEPLELQTVEPAALAEGVSNLVDRAPDRTDNSNAIPLPTVAAVRSQVQQLEADDRAQAWRRDCSYRQARSEVLDCPETRGNDYALAPGEEIYRALHPVRQVSRAQRSLPAVAANVDGLAARLASSAIPAVLADYLLEQTEAAITEGSATGNRAVQHMQRMTDRSAAAEQARMLLGDPWVINRARELQQRKVVER